MLLVAVSDLTRQFASEPVFHDLSLEIRPGQRLGLVGPNGTGKTTLLRLLAGLDEPDKGHVTHHPGTTVALLEQEPDFQTGRALFDEAKAALQSLVDLQNHLVATADELARAADPDERRQLERRYDRLYNELHHRDAYVLDHKVEQVLCGLGFEPDHFARPVETFSGGQQSRLMLAKLLLAAPDLMLLDEPSNHLDIDATQWLEDYLTGQSSAMVVVSHDRYFLDKVVEGVWELFDGRLEAYRGNFTAYWHQKEERRKVLLRTRQRQDEYIADQEDFIRRYHAGQRSSQAHDREKKLQRVERVDVAREISRPVMGFRPSATSGEVVVEVEDLTKGYDRPLFEDLSLSLERGQRLGILGPNGSGKTTLLRLMLGEIEPDRGRVRLGHQVLIGYYDQQLSGLPADKSVLDAAQPAVGSQYRAEQMRGLLARFGLRGEIVERRVGDLSGGEKSRLALAKLAAENVNLLVLDEPTNHLDLWARASLEESLAAFDGTAIVVSHDRYFLNQVTNRLVVLGGPRPRVIEGNYETYQRLLAAESADQTPAADTASAGPRRPRRPSSGDKPRRKRRFPYRKPQELEAEITTQEARLAELEQQLSHPATYKDGDRARQVQLEYADLKERLAQMYEHWEESLDLG